MKRLTLALILCLCAVLVPAQDVRRRPIVVSAGGPCTTASDNFNRADGGLGANWTVQVSFGSLGVVSNQAATDGFAVWAGAGSFTDDQCSQVTMVTVNASNSGAAGVRQSGTSFGTLKGYFCGHSSSTGNLRYRIFVYNADSTETLIATESGGSVNVANGDVIRLTVTFSGGTNTLTCSKNGSNIAGLVGITDTTLGTGGKPGFVVSSASDDWSGGAP